MNNRNLNIAKDKRNDEFYTQYKDISREMIYYVKYIKNARIYCNCDNPNISEFVNYFRNNYHQLELKQLIATHYVDQSMDMFSESLPEKPECYFQNHDRKVIYKMEGNGSYDSKESLNLLDKSDIVITNPPFSLFRDYIELLYKKDKKFIILGSMNAMTYADIFDRYKANEIRFGVHKRITHFTVPDSDKKVKLGNVNWFTNLDHGIKNTPIKLKKEYNERDYPKYDNYDAINVDKVKDIPIDYYGMIGVPITFLDKYNVIQRKDIKPVTTDDFTILGSNRGLSSKSDDIFGRDSFIDGKETFKRLFIKRR